MLKSRRMVDSGELIWALSFKSFVIGFGSRLLALPCFFCPAAFSKSWMIFIIGGGGKEDNCQTIIFILRFDFFGRQW